MEQHFVNASHMLTSTKCESPCQQVDVKVTVRYMYLVKSLYICLLSYPIV